MNKREKYEASRKGQTTRLFNLEWSTSPSSINRIEMGIREIIWRLKKNDRKHYVISPKKEKELIEKYWKILKKYQVGKHPGQLTNIIKQLLEELGG